jgi:hypothetical protein
MRPCFASTANDIHLISMVLNCPLTSRYDGESLVPSSTPPLGEILYHAAKYGIPPSSGRYTCRALFAEPCRFYALRPPAEAPDWLPPSTCPIPPKLRVTLNALVPTFQSTFCHILTRFGRMQVAETWTPEVTRSLE